jgi:5-methylcytosine-specific restriction endonuclease McrA
MDAALVELVWRRANSICEYCHLPHGFDASPFHIDHIIARKHNGLSVAANLALACYQCNLYKGPNIAGLDPQTNTLCPLFNPRQDIWSQHFTWQGAQLIGLTDVGRTTISVLQINEPTRLSHRESLISEGVFPPVS